MDKYELEKVIRESAPWFEADGKKWFIVERDLQVADDEVLQYAEFILAGPRKLDADAPERLNGATVGGKLIRWAPDTELTWKVIRSTFPDDATYDKAIELCTAATGEWNDAVDRSKFTFQFTQVAEDADAVFRFEYQRFSDSSLYAVAFFPNDPKEKRVVRIGPPTFAADSFFDPVGVIRHELGHVIGFRHEHIREEAGFEITEHVTGDFGDKPIGEYDSQSVMHYPIQDTGTIDFQLTDLDKEGFNYLYTLPADEVKEYFPF